MIIYIDENMPKMLANGINILQTPENYRLRLNDHIEVKSIIDSFGAGAKDEDWIPKAGIENSCIITQDYNINRIKHQRALCEKYNLGMFYFRPPSRNGFSYWKMVEMLIKHWPQIVKIASKEERSFSYKVSSKKAKLEKLKY